MTAEGRYGEVLAIVRRSVDPTTARLIEEALGDADRLSVIRDLFLNGKDLEAVRELRDLDPVGIRRLLPATASDEWIGVDQSLQITCRPLMPFRPTHLLISRHSAPWFRVNDIRVGMRSEFVQLGDVPAALFEVDAPIFRATLDEHGFATWTVHKSAEDRLPLRLDLPEVPVGGDIVIIATNISDEPRRFEAAWYGTTRAY